MCQDEPVRQELISVLESLRGITLATDSANADVIFLLMSPYLKEIPVLLQKYANCPEIVELIFELYVDVVQSQIVYLNKVSTPSFLVLFF